jgi:flotillin
MPVIIGLLLTGIVMLVSAIGLKANGADIGTLATVFLLGAGSLLSVIGTALLVIQKLYVKTKASEAFVRTGMGGLKVVMDGGSIVIPFMHQVVHISLKTLKIEVKREAKEAMLTKDNLRADFRAEFFVKVPADATNIQAAARSFGDGMQRAEDVKALIEDKLVSALRTAAVKLTLNELNSNREQFMTAVVKELEEDLKKNGLVLESATISKLDQTSPEHLSPDNVFDAQGRRVIAEITEAQHTQTNELKRAGELARKKLDVETKKLLLDQERDQSNAEAEQQAVIARTKAEQDASVAKSKAEQDAEVAKTKAEQVQVAREKEIETQRLVELADVRRQQEVEIAQQTRQQAVAVAAEAQKKAVAIATQEVEVAERQRQQAVAKAETERAAAETERANAEAEREKARQAITTVEQVAAAERDKQRTVITAQAEAEKALTAQKGRADADAYAKTALAEADKAAAAASAEATRVQAQAQRDAAVAHAEGLKAEQMVPVDVKAREVEIERDRVETVLKPELTARDAAGKVAQEFELEKLRIAAFQAIRIAVAQHTSQIFHGMQAKFFGTPDDVARAVKSFQDGNAGVELLNGAYNALPDMAKTHVDAAIHAVAQKMGIDPAKLMAEMKDGKTDAAATEHDSAAGGTDKA